MPFNNTIHSKNTMILVIFDRSWSEVDWLLPILQSLKNLKPEWNITTIFSPQWVMFNPINNNKTLEIELHRIVDTVIYAPQEGSDKKIFIPDLDSQEQVRMILIPSGKTDFKKSIRKKFKSAKIFMYPDGPYFAVKQNFNHPRHFNIWEKQYDDHDCMLIDSWSIAPELCLRFSDLKICAVGFPRYDKLWIRRLLNQPEFLNSLEFQNSKKYKRVFTFITKGPQREFPKDIFYYVMHSVFQYVFSDPQNYIMIKTHPRHQLSWIESCLNGYDSSQWTISTLHPIQQAALSDFVISVSSTCILDALAVNKPVIEFSPNIQPTEAFNIDDNGRLLSVFALMGLSVYIRTKEEMIANIENFFNPSADHSKWAMQQNAFKTLCTPNARASDYAANVIIKAILSYIGQSYQHLPILKANSLISGEKSLFLIQDENQNPSFHLEIKRIKAIAMPVSSIFFHELSNVFGIDFCVFSGTLNEHLTSEAAKMFKEVYVIETASDLYQIQHMKEFSNASNVHICNSAYILKNIISSGFKGRVLFWLDTHETSHITFKSKTQTPIIEELKIINQEKFPNSVILINNLKYFQPIVNDDFEAVTFRKYPDLSQLMRLLNRDNSFSVLGDVGIIYPKNSPITLSKGVSACTISRLYNGHNFDTHTIIKADEEIAFHLNNTEKEAIFSLPSFYDSVENHRCGGHYYYWRGLINFGEQKFALAKRDINIAFTRGCRQMNVLWFWAQSNFKAGDTDQTKKILEHILDIDKNFLPAHSLMSQIK